VVLTFTLMSVIASSCAPTSPPPAGHLVSDAFAASSMTWSPGSAGRVSPDGTAMSNQALELWSNATVSYSLTTSSATTGITVRARGDQCDVVPQMVVDVDGAQVMIGSVASTAWMDYVADVPVAAGNHTVSITFNNDDYNPPGCDSNLYLDTIAFGGVAPSDVTVTVDRAQVVGTSHMSMGVTHEHFSLDSWGDAAAVAAGKRLLQTSTTYQNQHLFGWGTTNPEPSPGEYDWSSLDERVDLMRQTGGTPVLTLCCSPDWMWGGAAGATDWSQLGTPPTHEHYADFAALAAQVARRYPDVKYFQVWNEMKGFWNSDRQRWDYESYTSLYNAVYDAVLAVRPDAQIGGPYVVVNTFGRTATMSDPSHLAGDYGTVDQRGLDVIDYWLANKHGAGFVTVDGYTANWDGVQIASDFTATQKFADIADWIGQRTSLPVWWAEWYTTDLLGPASNDWDHDYQNAVMSAALIRMDQSSVAVALRWQPQGRVDQPYQGDQESLFSDTREAGGGKPFPYYYTAKAFHDDFGPGTQLFRATSSSLDVLVLASGTHVVLVNQGPTAHTINMGGTVLTLAGYRVFIG